MASNLKIDDSLLNEALKLGNFKSKKDTVNQALKEFVQNRRKLQLLAWEGKVDFFEDYDPKALRNVR